MFLPIGDEPRPKEIPWVTWGLIAANVAVYLLISLPLSLQLANLHDPWLGPYLRAMTDGQSDSARLIAAQLSAYELFTFAHGFRPASPSVGSLLTGLFLHGGFLHLAGNMLFLHIFGDNVELFMGRWRFVVMYLASGIVATLFFAVFCLHSQVPLIGASGAISGVLGCYFVWFPHHRVRVLMVLLVFIEVIAIPARWVLGFYLVIENLLPFLSGTASGGVAYGAHIGGFLSGALFANYLHPRSMRQIWNQPVWWPAKAKPTTEPPLSAFSKAMLAGDAKQAWQAYTALSDTKRHKLTDTEVLQLADFLTVHQDYPSALTVLQAAIATRLASPCLPQLHVRAGLVLFKGLGRKIAAQQHFLTVLDLAADPLIHQAARQALAQIEASFAPPG